MLWLFALAGAGFVVKASSEQLTPEASSSVHRSQDDDGNYKFSYSIEDGWGSSNGRWEVGDANGNKRGGYTITDADGRRRYVQYVADEKGFRVVVNTNEPGTAPSLSGSSITKPAETKDDVEDDALLQKLEQKHKYHVLNEEAQSNPPAENYEARNDHDHVEGVHYQSYHDADDSGFSPEIHAGASATIEKSAFARNALDAPVSSKVSTADSDHPIVSVSPVPVRDVPGYFSSGIRLAPKSVYGGDRSELSAAHDAADPEQGLKKTRTENPPIVSNGWSSKKEFYRDYLKKKYAHQERHSLHPKQITVEHVEPIDPKTLLSYDRRFLPVVYSNLKQKLHAENDETAVESFIAGPDREQSSIAKFLHRNEADSSRRAQIVSSEPVFPVNIDPVRLPTALSPESDRYPVETRILTHQPVHHQSNDPSFYGNHEHFADRLHRRESYPSNLKASASATRFSHALTKRTGFAPRKYDEFKKSQPLMSSSLKDKSKTASNGEAPRSGGSGRDIYNYY